MTVTTTIASALFPLSGGNKDFTVNFSLEREEDALVYLRDENGVDQLQALDVDYWIEEIDDDSFVVAFSVDPGNSGYLVVKRKSQVTQDVVTTLSGTVNGFDYLRALDRLTRLVQEIRDEQNRALIMPPGTELVPLFRFGDADERENRVLVFDENGEDVITGPELAEIEAAAAYAGISQEAVETITNLIAELGISPVWGLSEDNTAAENDAAIASLKAANTGLVYDLKGRVYPVSEIPLGVSFENGGWLIEGAAGDAGTVDVVYFAPKTFDYKNQQVSKGIVAYEIGPQGTRHIAGRGSRKGHFMVVNSGPAHYANRMEPYIYRSTNNGVSWSREGAPILIAGAAENTSCFAMNAYGYLQIAIVRVREGSTTTSHKLMHRRLYERRRDQTVTFGTTLGSMNFTAELPEGEFWDVMVGDLVKISGLGSSVNNIVINSQLDENYVVQNIIGRVAYFTATNTEDSGPGATATGEETLNTPELEFIQSPWREKLVDGLSFGDALIASTEFSSYPTLLHHMQIWLTGTGDLRLMTGAHGGVTGPQIVTLGNLFATEATLVSVSNIGGLTQTVEPTFCRLENGAVVGTTRASTSGLTPARLWYSATGAITDATVWGLTTDAFGGSPVAVEVWEDQDLIFFVLTDTRDNAGVNAQNTIPLLLGWQQLSNFIVNGPNFNWWHLTDLFFSNMNDVSTSNAVGVPSICRNGEVLHIAFSSEDWPVDYDQDGQPRVREMRLAIKGNGPVGAWLRDQGIGLDEDAARFARAISGEPATPYKIDYEVGQGDADRDTAALQTMLDRSSICFIPPMEGRLLQCNAPLVQTRANTRIYSSVAEGPRDVTAPGAIKFVGNFGGQPCLTIQGKKTSLQGLGLFGDSAANINASNIIKFLTPSNSDDMDGTMLDCVVQAVGSNFEVISHYGRGAHIERCRIRGYNPIGIYWASENNEYEYDQVQPEGHRALAIIGNRFHATGANGAIRLIGNDFYIIAYDALTTGFSLGETVTGGTSGATGVVEEIYAITGTTGRLVLSAVSGTYQDNEALTSAGGAAVANGAATPEYVKSPQILNNRVDVGDQLIYSTIAWDGGLVSGNIADFCPQIVFNFLKEIRGVGITNNIIRGKFGDAGASPAYGIYLQGGSRNCRISNNLFQYIRADAILAPAGTTTMDLSLMGNNFADLDMDVTGNRAALRMGDATRVVGIGNTGSGTGTAFLRAASGSPTWTKVRIPSSLNPNDATAHLAGTYTDGGGNDVA